MVIRLTENQIQNLFIENHEMLEEGFFSKDTLRQFEMPILSMLFMGTISLGVAVKEVRGWHKMPESIQNQIITDLEDFVEEEQYQMWRPIANDVNVTVYNACAAQCNADFDRTASGFRLNLNDVASHRVVAMERTFMKEFGIKYGDLIKIEGTYKGKQDGVYQVQDTMNKRFANQHKIDVLVPNNIKTGGTLKSAPATVYVLNNKADEIYFQDDMKPSYKATKKL